MENMLFEATYFFEIPVKLFVCKYIFFVYIFLIDSIFSKIAPVITDFLQTWCMQ